MEKPGLLRRIIGDERRQAYIIPLLAILCSLIASAILLLAIGKQPGAAFAAILEGAGVLPKHNYAAGKGMITDVMLTLTALTPMIFAALAVTVAFKAGLFNIGVAGQMLFAGFIATVSVGYSEMPPAAAMPLVIVIGAAGGAAIGGLIGLLKTKFNINEVVSSIMLNYIIQYVTGFFILTRFVDALTRHSKAIEQSSRLLIQDIQIGEYRVDIPVFVLLAVAVTFLAQLYLNRTCAGFNLQAVGASPSAAQYFGVSPSRGRVAAMTLSGALAGVAGVMHYLGYYERIPPKMLADTGFEAIAVSLLGNANPVGGLFASILFTVISRGSMYMSSVMGVEREISQVITGLILLFSACGAFLKYMINKEGR